MDQLLDLNLELEQFRAVNNLLFVLFYYFYFFFHQRRGLLPFGLFLRVQYFNYLANEGQMGLEIGDMISVYFFVIVLKFYAAVNYGKKLTKEGNLFFLAKNINLLMRNLHISRLRICDNGEIGNA
jgi:hypothetical protein